jgi:hypothetical protein
MIPAHKCLHIWSRLCRCISPQKLFFCYHLPTRGRAGVKLGDAWYVSNVSIIFLMLHACFYTICLIFRYTSWHFYAYSRTNLLTSCHSASSLFSAVFVFQKWYTGNILRIGRNKFLKSYFTRKLTEIRRGVGGGPQGPHTPGRRGQGLGCASQVWGHLAPPLTSLLRL